MPWLFLRKKCRRITLIKSVSQPRLLHRDGNLNFTRLCANDGVLLTVLYQPPRSRSRRVSDLKVPTVMLTHNAVRCVAILLWHNRYSEELWLRAWNAARGRRLIWRFAVGFRVEGVWLFALAMKHTAFVQRPLWNCLNVIALCDFRSFPGPFPWQGKGPGNEVGLLQAWE